MSARRTAPRVAAHCESAGSELAWRLCAFFGFAAFASVEYASLLSHPPVPRALLAAGVATAAGGALALSGRSAGRPWLVAALRTLGMVLALLAGLAAAGVPVHLLDPRHWGTLAGDLHDGLRGLSSWLWPYLGPSRWARVTVLAVLAPALTVASGLYFWPSGTGAGERRLGALAILLALLVSGAANAPAGAWRVQGLILLALIAALLWEPSLRRAGGARAGAWLLACAVPALVAAPLLVSSEAWFSREGSGLSTQVTSFQWDQLYGPINWSRSAATMFVLSDPHPGLLRVTTLDRFDGLRFLRSNAPPGNPGLDIPRSNEAARSGVWDQSATVGVAGLQSNLFVSAGGVPRALIALGMPERARRAADGTLSAVRVPAAGDRYRLVSYDPTPTAAELRRAPRSYPAEYRPYVTFELPGAMATALTKPDLQADASTPLQPAALIGAPAGGGAAAAALARRMAASPYAPMFALARRLAAGQRSRYDVVERIDHFLRSGYRYDERPPLRRFPLEAFLFTDRRGYCQQFSGAMTLMLRMDGIPSRVGVGFVPSVFDALRSAWIIRAIDAHSWVEVFFPGIGWVAFDPTPPVAGAGISTAPVSKAALLRGSARTSRQGPAATVQPLAGAVRGSGGWGGWALIGAGGVLAIIAAALISMWVVGASRLHRLLDGDERAAIAELRDALTRTGKPVSPAMTLAQIEAQIDPGSAGRPRAYVRALRDALYAPQGPAVQDRRAAARGRADMRRALAANGGILQRARALLALPPGVSRRLR